MRRTQLGAIGAIATALLFWALLGSADEVVDQNVATTSNALAASTALKAPPLPPTEHWLHEDAEHTNKKRRKAWFKERHRTPPNIDYKAVEQYNGLQQIVRRNALSGRTPLAKGPRWVERGSDNQAGRMHVTRRQSDGGALYSGSAVGGLWRSNLEGTTWMPLGDNLYGGVHELAVLPAPSGGDDILIVATNGGLLHRSVDSGATWEVPTGVGNLWNVKQVLTTSDGSHTVFLLVTREGGSVTLYRSTDLGESFSNIYNLGDYGGDIWLPRDGDGRVYMLHDDRLFWSDDLGDNWTNADATIPASGRGGELVGSEAGAPRFYAAVERDGGDVLYRSDDLGASWTRLRSLEDYWSRLGSSIVDPDIIVWGGVEAHVSHDGGANFEVINTWGSYYEDPVNRLHADMMGFDVIPDGDDEVWYIHTDGGVYTSHDGMRTVKNISQNGLRVSQYYTTHTSRRNPEHIAAGAQDQGYQVTAGVEQEDEVLNFNQIMSGDYAHLTSSNGNHDYVYSVYPGVILIHVGEDKPMLYWADFPPGENYAWLPPIVADPKNKKAFFFPATQLYRYKEGEKGDWERELWSEHNFDPTGDGEYISALTFSPLDENRGYLVTNWGRLMWSDDRGVTWSESNDIGPEGQWLYGAALHASETDIDTVTVGGSGYGNPAVYRSEDGGQNWKPFHRGLPDTLVYCITEAPDGSGVLFAGTETSAYRRDPGSPWVDITSNEAPVTIYWSVETLYHTNAVRFGTYGRGIWDYELDPDNSNCYPVEDGDGDGYDCDIDCDDTDPNVYPGAAETCDGVEVSCDPSDLNEDDLDEDGYRVCDGDCDDNDASRSPGASEVECNEIDEDCSGADLCVEGCGCLTTQQAPASWLVLGGALLLHLRRRRDGLDLDDDQPRT